MSEKISIVPTIRCCIMSDRTSPIALNNEAPGWNVMNSFVHAPSLRWCASVAFLDERL